ncbi:MAG TPA: hypothetical protein VGF06_05225 [Terriglobales bacterium]|jgi:hypothetical protein
MDWKSIVQTLSYGVGALAAISSVLVYRRNSRLERARWMSSLYAKFYEQPELKMVRDVLDGSANSPEVLSMVQQETPGFTDYLNFFEFMAYLKDTGQLSVIDVRALFEYYLNCLRRHDTVRKYIADESKGYGYLKKLLASV